MSQKTRRKLQDSKGRITFITSIPIHILGIEAGDPITIDYTWDEIPSLLQDLNNEMFRIVVKESNKQECILTVDGMVLNLEDIWFDKDIFNED